MYNRRHSGKNYGFSRRRHKKTAFTPVILILCLSVVCGYATAKYVVEPVVNYVPQLTGEKTEEIKEDEKSSDETRSTEEKETKATDNIVEGDVNVEDAGKVKGYALQFGCYSVKNAAENARASLGNKNLDIVEQNGMYKIIGKIYKTKEAAKKELEKNYEADKAFITTIYE